MSSSYDLRAFGPTADGGPVKFPIRPYASAASYFDAYAEEMSRAAKSIEPPGLSVRRQFWSRPTCEVPASSAAATAARRRSQTTCRATT